MPNGGYPLWFATRFSPRHRLIVRGPSVRLLEGAVGARIADQHPAGELSDGQVAALLYHLAYWGTGDHEAFIGGRSFRREPIAPRFTDARCVYDF